MDDAKERVAMAFKDKLTIDIRKRGFSEQCISPVVILYYIYVVLTTYRACGERKRRVLGVEFQLNIELFLHSFFLVNCVSIFNLINKNLV